MFDSNKQLPVLSYAISVFARAKLIAGGGDVRGTTALLNLATSYFKKTTRILPSE